MVVDWLGDLYKVTDNHQLVGIISIAVAGVCGALVGLEREKRDKPAGLRTLLLICVGSTIFTMSSLLIAEDSAMTDRGRIAAQVVTGIGFLGAGAIIQERSRFVTGLTTAATIWTVAAIGVVIGAGFAAAGVVLALIVILTLTSVRKIEVWLNGPCSYHEMRIEFLSQRGKTRQKIQGILDDAGISESDFRFAYPHPDASQEEPHEFVDVLYCTRHRNHRAVIPQLARLADVTSVHVKEPRSEPELTS